uniref:Glycerol-3-phosphate acyltransferase 2, mitochondrial n=1 Tax=Mastacembelus armatus TaxID=205130 RepID=A0A3Q3MHZ8_9TELE
MPDTGSHRSSGLICTTQQDVGWSLGSIVKQIINLNWPSLIKKKLKTVPLCFAKLRPVVGQCCQQCTPNSLLKKHGQNYSLGFRNLLCVNETYTRYRGWLVRRVCCAVFVSGCKVFPSPFTNRLERVCQSNSVKKALTADHKTPEGVDSQWEINRLSEFLPLINTCISPGLLRFLGWVMLKMFSSVFGSVQVNLNHLVALHRGSLLVYVYVRQSIMDYALIPLVLFCHNLRVPYTVCPLQINSSLLRSVLQKVGVILLPRSPLNEQDAETDSLYGPVMTSLLRELLHEGQSISLGVCAKSGRGGQWLAHIRQLIKEGSVLDVSLVPVGISYDSVPKTNIQVETHLLLSLSLWECLFEMCESGRCRVDEWLPLQDLLLPVILNNSVFGLRRMSWLLPSSYYTSELKEPAHPERDLSIAIILHLIFSVTSCMAVMSTSIVSSLLLYRHRKGMSVSVLCRDVFWLTEELLFRNRDVGFWGSLADVVHSSLYLLAPHLIIAAVPSRKDPLILPRPTLAATLHLYHQAQIVTHTFILEAVGACAVSAMLCEVAASGVSSRVRSDGVDGERVKGDMEFDVVLCQSMLTERVLQLCHLLPPGYMPPCQSSHCFALDAIDSLVCCGILIMEEVPRDVPVCDFWKKDGALTWSTSDDPCHSDSDCEEQDLRFYKISQPSQCPEMLFYLCSMLAGHLRTLCWTTKGLDLINTPLPGMCRIQYMEHCSEEAAHTAVRTLIDLGVSDSLCVCVRVCVVGGGVGL